MILVHYPTEEGAKTRDASARQAAGQGIITNPSNFSLHPEHVNAYLFLLNNPLIHIDPTGNEPVQIGYVYVARGTIGGEPVVYTGVNSPRTSRALQ